MSKISQVGIVDSQVIYAEHVLRIINALSGLDQRDISIYGSLQSTGSFLSTGTSSFEGDSVQISSSLTIQTSSITNDDTITRFLVQHNNGKIYYRSASSISGSGSSASSSISSSYALTASFAQNGLQNDVSTPGNDYYYGTDNTGVKGWFPIISSKVISASYTLVSGDRNYVLYASSSSDILITLPTSSFNPNWQATIIKSGSGNVIFTGSGVFKGIDNIIYTQNAGAAVLYKAGGTWYGLGGLGSSSIASSSGNSLTVGTQGQIPFVSSSNNDLRYSNNLTYDINKNILVEGSGISMISGSGTFSNNFYLGLNHTDSSSGGGTSAWNFILGEQHTFSNESALTNKSIIDSFVIGSFYNKLHISSSGGNITTTGIVGSLNSMVRVQNSVITQGSIILGGAFNLVAPSQSNGSNTSTILGNFALAGQHNISDGHGSGVMGYWGKSSGMHTLVHGFATTFLGDGWGGIDPTFNPDNSPAHSGSVQRVIASGKHAINISANSPSQSVGFGALADYSGILFGYDHHLPSQSANSAIIGGNTIIGDSGSINTVYFPKIKIGRGLSASLPTIISASTILGRVNTDGEIGNITIGANLTFISGTLAALSSGSGGGTIDSSSLATTGSNFFIGTEVITGSLIVSGGRSNFINTSITSSIISGSQFTGSFFGTSSAAINAVSSSVATSASYALNGLQNDINNPGYDYYYGTDNSGSKGWFPSIANRVISASYTLVSNDRNYLFYVSSSSDVIITLPTGSFNTNWQASFIKSGSGNVKFTSSGQFNAPDAYIYNQFSAASVIYKTGSLWYGLGGLGSSSVPQRLELNSDGAGSAISTGSKQLKSVSIGGTMTNWVLVSDVSTTSVVSVWKKNGAIPTTADSILTASLSAGTISSGSVNIVVTAGDIIRYEIKSNNNATYLNLEMKLG